MLIKINVTGIDQAIRGADHAEQAIKVGVAADLDWFGRMVSEDAKADHPYQDHTFILTNSIGYEVGSWRGNFIMVTVFAMASYAEAVEFGTAKSRPYPFLFPKFYQYIGELQARLHATVERAISDGGRVAGI